MKSDSMTQCEDILSLTISVQQQQFFEQMLHFVNIARLHHTIIELTLYDELEELKVIGTVEQIDGNNKRVKIDGEWFQLDCVIAVNEQYNNNENNKV